MLKLFIVAPYFPPSSLPPSQRVRLLMPYLQNQDVEVTIFTIKHKHREEIADPWMEELAGNGYKKVTVRCLSPKLTRVFGFGDSGFRMMPFLFFKLLKEIKKQRNAFVLFPVPPWNTLIIVPLLWRLTGMKYGIDYIDPWIWELPNKKSNFKERASQWLAKIVEKKVVKHASVIFAVSDGINNQLIRDYPFLDKSKLVGVPYGGEEQDYKYFLNTIPPPRNYQVIRYIGGIGPDMPEVAFALLLALKEVACIKNIKVEFIGSSYAGGSLAKGALTEMLERYELKNFIVESPERVSYKKAIELSMDADLLMLFGGMKTYYAASKLMGMLLSKKPFVAFLHRDSFPADFLKRINFKYLVTYSEEVRDLPKDHISELKIVMINLLSDLNSFKIISVENTDLKNYTAKAMTNIFLENIKKYA